MYKNEVRKLTKWEWFLVALFGSYGMESIYGPDKEGNFKYEYYYKLFGKKHSLGFEWSCED